MKIPFILCQYKCTLDRNNFAAASKFEFKILARGGGGKGRFEKIFLRVATTVGLGGSRRAMVQNYQNTRDPD